MEFEWDGKKAISNLKKHGIEFADALSITTEFLWLSILGVETGFG